ncbi:hypothetical protein D3C87_1200010 [compost metagenome]
MAIANEFIRLSNFTVSPMKLQKLMYYAHGWCLRLTENALIDDSFEAWQYGPVVDSVYHAFKRFGNRHVTMMAKDYEGRPFGIDADDAPTLALLQKIFDTYGPIDAITLSQKTHQQGSPWDYVFNNIGPGNVITNAIIKEKFIP